MPTGELLAILTREYPNGVSFEPMAVRLLRKKAPFTDSQIERLKAEMFQLGNGLWVSSKMISDNKSRLTFAEKANEWLKQYGCFSVEKNFLERDDLGTGKPLQEARTEYARREKDLQPDEQRVFKAVLLFGVMEEVQRWAPTAERYG